MPRKELSFLLALAEELSTSYKVMEPRLSDFRNGSNLLDSIEMTSCKLWTKKKKATLLKCNLIQQCLMDNCVPRIVLEIKS